MKHRSESSRPGVFTPSRHIGNASFAKALCQPLKGNLDRTVFVTKKQIGMTSCGSNKREGINDFRRHHRSMVMLKLIFWLVSLSLSGPFLWPSIGAEPIPQEPKATLNVPSTVRLMVTRSTPWSDGSGSLKFDVSEATGQADATDLTISFEPLVATDTKLFFKANISGELNHDQVSLPHIVQRGQIALVQVYIKDVGQTGSAEGKINYRSKSLSAPAVTKLEILVRDHWLWALIPLFLGTLLSYWSLRWRSVHKPLLLMKIEAKRLEGEARKLASQRPDLRETLQEVYRFIREVIFYISVDNDVEARKLLEQAKQKLQIAATTQPQAGQQAAPPQSNKLTSALYRPLGYLRSVFAATTEDHLLRRLRILNAFRSLLIIMIVTLLGLLVVYKNQPFGGWDYITAFLYGFGIDQTVKGVGLVAEKV